ncbi:hypothetical protein CORC01_02668 [Colletotrichum orchidophilum]|uniref:Uncharacterized protein n=1 Tax=Colletotrichum orchidophilum TaxID=1209926 RepID=A0A1G4BKW0_9PEZI|nr:uncharacterized protein CORC01_02668 [Colletotrichum orchidophilum]OHF02089.1 hypothetical protein CORC01_02668 [Colletotrichum orchidophilum]
MVCKETNDFLTKTPTVTMGNPNRTAEGRFTTPKKSVIKLKGRSTVNANPEVHDSLHFLEAVQDLVKTLAKNKINRDEFAAAMIAL